MAKKRNENQTIKSIDELREEGVAFIDKSIEELHDYGIAATEKTEKHEPAEEKKIEVDVTDIDPTIILALAAYLRNPTETNYYRIATKMEEWAYDNDSGIKLTTRQHIAEMINAGIDDAVKGISSNIFDSVKNHYVGDMSCYPQTGYIMDRMVHVKRVEKEPLKTVVHLNTEVYYVWKKGYSICIMNAGNDLHKYTRTSAGETMYSFKKYISVDGNEIPYILRHKKEAMAMNPDLNSNNLQVLEWAWEKWGKSLITKR